LKLWVISSLEGENWTEMDQKTNNQDLGRCPYPGSFTVAGQAQCCFIRLTQTGDNHFGEGRLAKGFVNEDSGEGSSTIFYAPPQSFTI
jgi:hypothetical protein